MGVVDTLTEIDRLYVRRFRVDPVLDLTGDFDLGSKLYLLGLVF